MLGENTLDSAILGASSSIIEDTMHLVIQLSVILFAAKFGGELTQRFLRMPPVLGELAAGVIIGPFALGALAIPGFGPLFPNVLGTISHNSGSLPVSSELYALSQVASVVLLFVIGLETDLRQFFKYAGPAFGVALGGVVLPFALGMVGTALLSSSLLGKPLGFTSPEALFMAAAMTATSIGITARILTDMNSMDTPEGVTIVAAAVMDDVVGIIILTVVVGVSLTGSISGTNIAWVSFKAIAFWVILTGVGIWAAPHISTLIKRFTVSGAAVGIFLALAFLAAGLSEFMGLALIIGAYSMGLALSRTDLAHKLRDQFDAIFHALVPIFFVVMGMLVDVGVMAEALSFGLAMTILATLGKVLGSGLPATLTGFNIRGSCRIGFGMLPRGEVGLIIAGIGLSRGAIGQDIFGVAIFMTVITTVIASIALAPLFRWKGSGKRNPS